MTQLHVTLSITKVKFSMNSVIPAPVLTRRGLCRRRVVSARPRQSPRALRREQSTLPRSPRAACESIQCRAAAEPVPRVTTH